MNDEYIPRSGKAEWHITYKCNLRCVGCNRFTFISDTHTPDMTIEDAERFCREGPKFGFHTVTIIGGEPTLHSDFLKFVELAIKNFKHVYLFSNGTTSDSRLLVNWAIAKGVVVTEPFKNRSIVHTFLDYCAAPKDFNITRKPCRFCSCHPNACGISVDSVGYTFCCIGGALDAVLNLGARTKNLADLFDRKFIVEHQKKLCSHCGVGLKLNENHPDRCQKKLGVDMSETWLKAVEKWTRKTNS